MIKKSFIIFWLYIIYKQGKTSIKNVKIMYLVLKKLPGFLIQNSTKKHPKKRLNLGKFMSIPPLDLGWRIYNKKVFYYFLVEPIHNFLLCIMACCFPPLLESLIICITHCIIDYTTKYIITYRKKYNRKKKTKINISNCFFLLYIIEKIIS